MEESIKHASTSLTCQEFCNAFEPSEEIHNPQKLCGQTMRVEEKMKWNQEGSRGRKGNKWCQVAEGNQILNNQVGQKTTLQAGKPRTRAEAIFQIHFRNTAVWYQVTRKATS